jgi:hypothetical protein
MMCTAYLTGMHAHEYFFKMTTIAGFAALVMPPTVILIVLSLLAPIIPNMYIYIAIIAALMLLAGYFFLEKIGKWDGREN